MKIQKLFTIAMCFSSAIFYSCERFPIGEDEPSKEEPTESGVKYVESVEIHYLENEIPQEEYDIYEYKYDDENRIIEVELFSVNSEEKYIRTSARLDYSTSGEINMIREIPSSSIIDKIVLKQQEGGKTIVSLVEDEKVVDVYEFKCDSEGYLKGLKNASSDGMISFNHTSKGFLSGLWFNKNGELCDIEEYSVGECYPNRYMNNRVNVDLNYLLYSFIYYQHTSPFYVGNFYDIFGLSGLCGKLSSCYIEGHEDVWGYGLTSNPDYYEHRLYVTSVPLCNITYKFDNEGCPVEIERRFTFTEEERECDCSASNIPINPLSPKDEWKYKIIIENNIESVISTSTESNIIKITYR